MADKARKIADELTPAARDALRCAREVDGDLHVPIRTYNPVRRRLIDLGLLSGRRSAFPLTGLGREVRALLLEDFSRG